MITNKQKWLLGGLIALSTAIWTPQIMERLGGATSAQVSVGSGPDEAEMLQAEMQSMGTLPDAPAPVARRQEPLPQASASASVQRSPGGSGAIVSEVLRTLRQSEAFHVNSDLTELVLELPAEVEGPESETALPPLLAFVQTHPLRGTIVGETTQMALIGKHRVNVGELVPGTAATLTDVGRGRATLTEGEMVVELVLQPLETSAGLMQARSRAQSSSGNGNAGAAGPLDPLSAPGNEPSAEAVPGTVTDVPVSTPTELPGSPGDF